VIYSLLAFEQNGEMFDEKTLGCEKYGL